MDTGLKRKVVIVTGAASGIGLATVRALLEESARVVAVDLDADALRQVDADTSVCRTIAADISEPDHVARMVADGLEFGERIDVLVNDAGIGYRATLTETTLEQWERTFAVNVRGMFLTCRAVIPHMLEDGQGGVIVNVASAAALAAVGQRAAYCASKAAVISLTRSITLDYAARGIRANAVAPGVVDTPWVGRILAGAADPDGTRQAMADRQVVRRLGKPEEVADAIVYLASDRSSFMHGSTLVVDGGFSAQ